MIFEATRLLPRLRGAGAPKESRPALLERAAVFLYALREAGASHAQVDLSFRERSGSVAELLGLNRSEWASLQVVAQICRAILTARI